MQHHVLKRQTVDAPECLVGIVDCDVLEREVLHLTEELRTVDDAVLHVHVVRIPDGRTRSGREIAVAYVRTLDVPQWVFALEVTVAAHDVATLLDARFAECDANVVELHVVDFEERTLSAEYLVSYLFHNVNFTKNITPLNVSSRHMASHTPRSPIDGASMAASVMRTPHIDMRFITLGAIVLAAPTNTP